MNNYNIFKNIEYSFEKIINIINKELNNNAIDKDFKKFYNNSLFNNCKFFIISSGFKQIIQYFTILK